MFAIPQLMMVPALTGVGVSSLEWPALGAFLAWTLIAALVGTGLGALRRMGAQPPSSTLRPCAAQPHGFHAPSVVDDHNHQEAA